MSYLVTLLVALLGVTLCPAYLYEPDNVDTWMDDGMDFLQDIRLWKPIDTVDVNGGCCLPPEMQIFEGMMLAEAGPGRGRMGQPRVIIVRNSFLFVLFCLWNLESIQVVGP